MRNCPNCGNAVQDGCLFCTHCGEKLEEHPVGEGMPVQEAVGGEAPMQNSANAAQGASAGATLQENKEKKGGKPYFLIGLVAVLILVLAGVFVLGKTVLSMGLFLSPKQKFLKYQADYFHEKLNDLDKLEIFPLTKKNITFTINGEVRGNKEVAKYLEDSSIVVKTKTNPEKGSYQASLLFNIMGEDVLDAYGEYADGKLGLAFPSLEKKFYQGELQSILSNSSDTEIELPNFNKKENRKLAEKLFKKYGSLISEYFTEENFTVEKGSFTMPIYGEDFEEKEFKGTIYRFKPSAEDLEGILEKFADKLEKDEDCAKFLIQSGLGIMISEHIGYDEFIDESRLSDFADWLRENAEELAEELEEKHIMWVLTMEGREVRKIQILTDLDDDGEFEFQDGDRTFFNCISGRHEKIRAELFSLRLREDEIAFSIRNVYTDKGKTLDGNFYLHSPVFPVSPFRHVEYSVEKGKKDKMLALPYGEYDFSDALGDGLRGKMTVTAGKKNSTDYEIKISGLEEDYLPGIKTLSIHVNAKEGADLSKPKGKTVDISDYTLYEVNELGEAFSEELSNIGEEIFGN